MFLHPYYFLNGDFRLSYYIFKSDLRLHQILKRHFVALRCQGRHYVASVLKEKRQIVVFHSQERHRVASIARATFWCVAVPEATLSCVGFRRRHSVVFHFQERHRVALSIRATFRCITCQKRHQVASGLGNDILLYCRLRSDLGLHRILKRHFVALHY